MLLELEDPAMIGADALKSAVAIEEAVIVDTDGSVFTRHQFAVQPDALSHGHVLRTLGRELQGLPVYRRGGGGRKCGDYTVHSQPHASSILTGDWRSRVPFEVRCFTREV
jgi:hypothetical protein